MGDKRIKLDALFQNFFQILKENFAGNKKGYIFAALFDQNSWEKGRKKTVL